MDAPAKPSLLMSCLFALGNVFIGLPLRWCLAVFAWVFPYCILNGIALVGPWLIGRKYAGLLLDWLTSISTMGMVYGYWFAVLVARGRQAADRVLAQMMFHLLMSALSRELGVNITDLLTPQTAATAEPAAAPVAPHG